ncbi:actin binding Rho activating protein b [Scophthalmus maximus]|uniref:actin binding Rho activating protein b n=1 Tax=Scophthalmus maximus TaxID=52904 RepID=UPI001FA8D91A|nr:actin binding Rho activating protein b [Scophthalmus maximus]
MSDSQRKPSDNKNIKKLRAVSMVCGLASRWQQWVAENEEKQASEPSGWAPSSPGGPAEEPRRKWVPKKPPAAQVRPTEVSQMSATTPGESAKTSAPHEKAEAVVTPTEPPVASPIQTKQAGEAVTGGAGDGLLTVTVTREAPPPGEEMDRLLTKKSSPTRRRKCSNMVSSLTKCWRLVESEQKLGKGGERPAKSRAGGSDQEESGRPEAWQEGADSRDARSLLKDGEQNDCAEDSESSVKIKRPAVPAYKRESEDANKINALSKKYSAVGSMKSRWQNWASEHAVSQRLNPFSEYFDYDYSMSLRLQKGEEGYGRPRDGTKTAERAKRAEQHIHREIADMCYVIRTMADPDADGRTRITFGELFDRYVRISDKVVGILMRARKHGKVAFEGEMLWQGQDDGVVITLLV